MNTNNTPRLLLLVLCLATILAAVSSCNKDVDKPVQDPGGYTVPAAPDYYFSRVRYYQDGRKPATDTIWTLHLTTQALVDQYAQQDGYTYATASTYTELGTMWAKTR